MDNTLNLQHHINYIFYKVAKGIGITPKIRKLKMNIYKAYTMPYIIHIWSIEIMYWEMHSQFILANRLYYKKVVRIVIGVKPRTPAANLFDNLNIMKVNDFNVFLIAQVKNKVHTADVITRIYYEQNYPYAWI